MVVLLFDIDGTFAIQTGGAGGAALMTAFADLFGVAEPKEVPFSGRTDRGEICRNLFRVHGVDDTDGNWHRLKDEYLRRLLIYLPQREGLVLPGIERLLDHLAAREDVGGRFANRQCPRRRPDQAGTLSSAPSLCLWRVTAITMRIAMTSRRSVGRVSRARGSRTITRSSLGHR